MRKAVSNTRKSLLLTEMMKMVPKEEVWEAKAIVAANRRITVANLTAEMPQREEWEKKAAKRRASIALAGESAMSSSFSASDFVPR